MSIIQLEKAMETVQDSTLSSILFINGDKASSQTTIEILTAAGYRTVWANSVAEVEIWCQSVERGEVGQTDLILLDVSSSQIDGLALFTLLKSKPSTTHQPIVLLAGESLLDTKIDFHQLGVADFVTKPYVPRELLFRIRLRLQLSKERNNTIAHLFQDVHERNLQLEEHAVEKSRLLELEQQQRKLALELLQSEKLAATGRLAASLAHEINNPLQAIHSCLQLLVDFDLSAKEQNEYINMALEESIRMIDLVTRILDFARPSSAKMEPVEINEIVHQVLQLMHKHMEHGKWAIQQTLSDDLPQIRAIPDQLAQVIMSLLINAIDAMPDGGTLSIQSRLSAESSGCVEIVIRDTGIGIPAEIQSGIFEPFFSTKVDRPGLGLSVAYGIISRHKGSIHVESSPQQGAKFILQLPLGI